MSWPRFLWLPLVLCFAGVALAPLAFPSSPAQKPPEPPPSGDDSKTDPAATRTIEQALALFHPARVAWLEMTFWTRVTTDGLNYEATGHFLSGPNQRFRVKLETQVGGTRGQLYCLGDGKTLWKATRLAEGPWTAMSRLDLATVMANVGPGIHPHRVRDEFMECPSCGWIHGMLEGLRTRVRWVRQETVHRNGRDLVEMTGTWNVEALRGMNVGAGAWPDDLPRHCRVDLDAGTLWPCRIEWWGPKAGQSDEVLLAQMEYREPKINVAPLAERCVREFGFDPGKTAVVDQTQAVLERLRAVPQP